MEVCSATADRQRHETNSKTGGWVIGSLKSPEYPYPVQIWDSWAALKLVHSNASELGIDPSRVSIGGLSAGGHLSAVLALLARDEPNMPPLKLQMLVVPAVDCRFTPIEGHYDAKVDPYESHVSMENAPCLPLNRMRWF